MPPPNETPPRRAAVRALVALAAAATPLGAQEPRADRLWTGSAQANASVFFGNTEQRVFGARGSLARADAVLELRADLQSLYGDATAPDAERRAVIKRLWLGILSADYRPRERVSPFVFATVESSYEKRIALRYSGGVGVKRTFVRTERTESSLSAAVLDERTRPRDSTVTLPTERLTRWSLRGRIRHDFDDRVRVSHVTFWQPRVTNAQRFLVTSTTDLRYKMTDALGLTFSFLDNYDSEARRRGARAYNDGQLLFGINASW